MNQQRRFSGGQVTTIVVALAVVAVGTPATVFAATGTSVRLVDGSNSHRAASVSKSGAVKVAVSGTSSVRTALPAEPFSVSTFDGNKLISTDPCGTKYAISSFSLTNLGGGSSAGVNPVTVGSTGDLSGDVLALAPASGQSSELTFSQPLIVTPPSLPKGNVCKKIQLFEDGGGNGSVFTLVGYRIP